jgi:hypothetical protein
MSWWAQPVSGQLMGQFIFNVQMLLCSFRKLRSILKFWDQFDIYHLDSLYHGLVQKLYINFLDPH